MQQPAARHNGRQGMRGAEGADLMCSAPSTSISCISKPWALHLLVLPQYHHISIVLSLTPQVSPTSNKTFLLLPQAHCNYWPWLQMHNINWSWARLIWFILLWILQRFKICCRSFFETAQGKCDHSSAMSPQKTVGCSIPFILASQWREFRQEP